MLNCYCQLSSSVIFRQYGVSQSECKIDRPRPGLPQSRTQSNACARARMALALGCDWFNVHADKTGTPKLRGSGCQFPQSQCHPSPRTGIALGTRMASSSHWSPGNEVGAIHRHAKRLGRGAIWRQILIKVKRVLGRANRNSPSYKHCETSCMKPC
jgi:hypothetical protein